MAVSLEEVTQTFGAHRAIDGISAEIGDGEFFVVLGPSGCGKSTLLRAIAGLDRIDGGMVALDRRTVSGPGRHVPPEDRDVGVVFQSYALWPHMDVRDNVAFALQSTGLSRSTAREAAIAHLDTVALTEFAQRRPADLSGGQRQRVALARCLAGGAHTVLMDEPLANLDPHLRASMEEEIAAFHAHSGATTIYITHDQREAMALADRIAVMARGRFQQIATPRDLYECPATAEVARFVGRSAILTAQLADNHAWIGGQSVPVRGGAGRNGTARIVLRPDDLHLGDGPLPANLTRVFYRGGVWEGLAEAEGIGTPLPITSSKPIRPGDRTSLTLTGAWVLPASEAPGYDTGRQPAAHAVK